jgi:pyruvate ferredoxin oxidoreductase gamma subunit
MYRIRFHGRGGQGVKTAGRILGAAFFIEGFEVQDAPLYGAERRGAPVFSYVRADRKPINERGIIRTPDLVVVADDSLMAVPAAGVIKGILSRTVILISSNETAETWKKRMNISSTVIILPQRADLMSPPGMHSIGSLSAAAAASLSGVISGSAISSAIREELAMLGDAEIEETIRRAIAAYDLMAEYRGCVTEGTMPGADSYEKPEWTGMPLEYAWLSAPAVHAAATSMAVKTGLWRTMRPVIDHERCGRCWWVCSTFCPDSAISLNSEGYPEIDYDHCKGCMICAARCLHHAIEIVPEHETAGGDRQ